MVNPKNIIDMKKTILIALLAIALSAKGQNTYEGNYTRPVGQLMNDVESRFGVKLKYNVDTAGVMLPFADFRVRPYSIEATLDNICKPLGWNWWKQSGNTYKIKPYEYARRHTDEGEQMLSYLSSLYTNRDQFEARRGAVRREVRQLLGLDLLLDSLVHNKPILGKTRKYDGYQARNLCIETLPGQHVFATIYLPAPDKATKRKWGSRKYALIISPNGHFADGRYRKDQQQRMATLARMGAVCVSYDLYGWGESEYEVGAKAHRTSRAHTMQALNGLVLLNYMLRQSYIDTTRVAACGGSGGGTQTVLLSVLEPRLTVIAPVVSLASHFDGGCPCESGMPIQLAGGGTCNAELAAFFAPKPMLVVSDGGDWTASVPTVEMPYLKRCYAFYGKEQMVENVHLPNERHDFGPNKRRAVYDFFVRTFGLDASCLDESKATIELPSLMKSLYK